MLRLSLLAASLLAACVATAQDVRTPAPAGAAVYIIAPAAGEAVRNPVTVKFGLSGMGVAPAGVPAQNTGHHHLLIDVEELPPPGQAMPATDKIRHFGGGQTETTLTLPPGPHTLRLVLGDHNHVPHEPPIVSPPIAITVLGD